MDMNRGFTAPRINHDRPCAEWGEEMMLLDLVVRVDIVGLLVGFLIGLVLIAALEILLSSRGDK